MKKKDKSWIENEIFFNELFCATNPFTIAFLKNKYALRKKIDIK